MARVLIATPIADSSDEDLAIPSTGPEAAPPLEPIAHHLTLELVNSSAVVGVEGTYPGPNQYPGGDFLAGRGTDLVASQITPKTLTGVPA